ncbi:MAG TPA: elongation factor P [Peptococcaceae bacterium]|jgi:elongation factor P|nr:elongation factor P [Clostridia bacterium]HOB81527.1 elongation factor P [Peptococcaceae bacterium]HPZ71981.1 elongation factor P [Peptococcaceae bacterium]HQD53615.1 elongation factor P [Peptococcaceae bacterium]
MISTTDFRTGITFELEGDVVQLLEFQHVKPGKGAAFVRCKLRSVKTGAVIEKTFRPGEKFPKAHIDRKEMQYLYKEGDTWVFMDTETYEQVSILESLLEDAPKYLKENMTTGILFYQGQVIGIDLPKQVELKVVATEPGVKGDTATGGSKPATLETGLVVQVPFFVNENDVLIIDTRTGEYVSRA